MISVVSSGKDGSVFLLNLLAAQYLTSAIYTEAFFCHVSHPEAALFAVGKHRSYSSTTVKARGRQRRKIVPNTAPAAAAAPSL